VSNFVTEERVTSNERTKLLTWFNLEANEKWNRKPRKERKKRTRYDTRQWRVQLV
jgi:hypothetical protein